MSEHLDDKDPAGRLTPGTIIGNVYEIVQSVASGGMGFIYRTKDRLSGRPAALKVMRSVLRNDDASVKRFIREAKTVAELEHPNIIKVYDYGTDSNKLLYIAMEWLDGEDLGQVLDRTGVMAPARAAYLCAEVAKSLAAAHNKGVIHRDLKPENIVLLNNPSGGPEHVKVLDFGIAKIVNKPAQTQLTMMGTVCGTPEYMSPEQALGKELDGRSDIYALGCMLYTLLTGKVPFDADIALQIVMRHLNDEFPRLPPEIPKGMAEIIYRSTQKAREDRYATILEFSEVLEEFVIIDEVSRSVSEELGQLARLAAEGQDDEDAATRLETPMWVTPATGTGKLVLPQAEEPRKPPPPGAAPMLRRPPPQAQVPMNEGSASSRKVPSTQTFRSPGQGSPLKIAIIAVSLLVGIGLVVLILVVAM